MLEPSVRPAVFYESDMPRASHRRLLHKALSYADELSRMAPNEKRAGLFGSMREVARHSVVEFSNAIKRLATEVCLLTGRRLPILLRAYYRQEVYNEAADSYVPRVYPGRAVILGSSAMTQEQMAKWAGFVAGGADVHALPAATHTDILQDRYVRVWSEHLVAGLRRAQAAR